MPLSCDVCVKSVSDALYSLGGITKVEGDLENQLIAVEGSGTFHLGQHTHTHTHTHTPKYRPVSARFSDHYTPVA